MMASRSAATAPSTSAGGGLAGEREAQHGRLVVGADRLQHVVGAARARRAGRPRRRVDPARLQRVQHRLGGQPRERQRADVGHARRAGHRRLRLGEAAEVGQRRQHLALQPIALAAHAIRDLRVALGGDQLGGDAQADPPGQVLGPRAQPALLPPAVPQRREAHARPHPERAGPLRPVELVAGQRQRVGAQARHAQRKEPDRLHAVDVQVRAVRVLGRDARQPVRDLGDRLDRAELVVDQHDRDDRGVGAHRRDDVGGGDHARAVGRHHGQLVALADQHLGGAQHRGVLDRGDDQVTAARARRRADQAQRIGLGAAAGEQDLRRRRRAQQLRDPLARLLDRARRRRAQRVRRRRVREQVARRARHRLQHFGRRRRRGGVVQINHRPQYIALSRAPGPRPMADRGFLR